MEWRNKRAKKGTSIITVTSQDGEKTASCKITVTGEGKSIPFIDVSKSDWFYEAVKFSYEIILLQDTIIHILWL